VDLETEAADSAGWSLDGYRDQSILPAGRQPG
jgi:hypothetical protein